MAADESKSKLKSNKREDLDARLKEAFECNDWNWPQQLQQLRVGCENSILTLEHELKWQTSIKQIVQDNLPLDRTWHDLPKDGMTRVGDSLDAKHPELKKLSSLDRRQVLQQQWKSLRDKYTRDNKISKDGT